MPLTFALHKPRGHTSDNTTSSTPHPSVYSLIPSVISVDSSGRAPRAIGRLDVETSGLLLFTTDGKLSEKVRNSGVVSKRYVATVAEVPSTSSFVSLRAPLDETTLGAVVSAGRTYARGTGGDFEAMWTERRVAEKLSNRDAFLTEINLTLREGRYHHVRRLIKRANLKMRHLARTAIGDLELSSLSLAPGESARLSPEQIGLVIGGDGLLSGETVRREDAAAPVHIAELSPRGGANVVASASERLSSSVAATTGPSAVVVIGRRFSTT